MGKLKIHTEGLFRKLSHPVFIVFLVLSLMMWYVSKLTHHYTTTLKITLVLENSYNSNLGVINEHPIINCKVEGVGYKLLLYKLLPSKRAIPISIGDLRYNTIEYQKYRKSIVISSLFDAMNGKLNDLEVISILTPTLEVVTSPLESKRVPIISRIEIYCHDRYKLMSFRLTPDSITVNGIGAVLDTLSALYTKPQTFRGVNQSLPGTIALEPITGVTFPIEEVSYLADVESYTTLALELPVQLIHVPEALTPLMLPERVVLQVDVSEKNYDPDILHYISLYCDYCEKPAKMGNTYKVHPRSLPSGVSVRSICPAYVEIFFNATERSKSDGSRDSKTGNPKPFFP